MMLLSFCHLHVSDDFYRIGWFVFRQIDEIGEYHDGVADISVGGILLLQYGSRSTLPTRRRQIIVLGIKMHNPHRQLVPLVFKRLPFPYLFTSCQRTSRISFPLKLRGGATCSRVGRYHRLGIGPAYPCSAW
jgi:hypothetical protein